MKRTDFIVVGQGLAGSVLALKLIESNYSVKVIDSALLSSSSKIAAGIWNPVVFKRLTKSWMIDELLPEMLGFYRNCEKMFSIPLVTERPIIKLFSEQQEVDLWLKKANGELKDYLDKNIYHTSEFENINVSEFGYSKVLQAGNLNVKLFLDSTREYLIEKGCYLNEEFDHKELRIADHISYKNIEAVNIVFAEGYLIKKNPVFDFIPFKPAKGEVLNVSAQNLNIGHNIINKNAFVLKLEEGDYKLGATYNWEDLTEQATETALKELLEKARKISSVNFNVMRHEAGVRPSVADRRPVIGAHPLYKNVFVFNGLGTKGVMLAPYFAQKLLNNIKSNENIPAEVNVSRFFVN